MEIQVGMDAMRHGRKDEAGVHFWRALAYVENVLDLKERRDLLSWLSNIFLGAGFEDLALMAVQDALEADNRLGNQRYQTSDSITYANIHHRLGNLRQAEKQNRWIIKSCLTSGDYSNAASASTNLAGILANDDYLEEADNLLEKSLEYLQKENFPDTEIKTRLLLVQILELQKGNPERTFSEIRTLLDRFISHIPPQYLDVLVRSIENGVKRYRLDHPDIVAEAWKRQKFPELYKS